LTTNNKVNEEAVNSLKGSTKKWSPNDQGSGITYVVNGQNNTAQFVDGRLREDKLSESQTKLA
jgi:hypothetical protein